jgi:4-diphosphocytidyl-2-C-methyl-D-erythritol kinase
VLYRCYAKINLTLEIHRRREDGFHDLASIVHTINLADDLRIEAADELLTRVEGLHIDPDTNLVSRAAALIASATGARRGAELSLVKRIPAAAGLGGGSSDAATTLVGLNALWGSRLSLHALSELAAELGSDVPFFVRGGAALMQGRGEKLEPLPPLIGHWLVLLVPAHDVIDKTRRLYGALDPRDFSDGELTARVAGQLRERTADTTELGLGNGFDRVARSVFPGLSEVWERAEAHCARPFHLSGAGPALFAFAASHADAREQSAKLSRQHLTTYVVRTVKHARASVRFARGRGIGYA